MIPKYREIKYRLVEILTRGGFKAHDRLPSERELARELGVNGVTLAKALAELAQDGVLYRRPRSGTFMAPVSRRGQVLVVTMGNPKGDPSFPAFFRGVMMGLDQAGGDFYPVHLLAEDFLRALPDLDLIFRDIAFVAVYRDAPVIHKALAGLEQKGIPWCFYGSDAFATEAFPRRALLYGEERIADLALDRIFAGPPGPHACATAANVTVTVRRRARFIERLALRGRTLDPALDLVVTGQWTMQNRDKGAVQAWMSRVVETRATVFSTQDHLSMRILQIALEMGFRAPDHFRIVSVDNLPFAEMASPPLTTVDIPVMADGERLMTEMVGQFRGPHPFRLWSEVKLVVRQSG